MWVLRLNDMRAANIENLTLVATATEREALERHVAGEKVELYRDGQWAKVFRKGGPMEWFNDPWNVEEAYIYAGTRDEWANTAAENWDNQIGALPSL